VALSWQLPVLFATGLTAGFVDSIAGGGGLITVPVLLSTGLDPTVALGTNKIQATCGSGSAAWHYAAAQTFPWRDCLRGFLLSALGAAAGALTVQHLDPGFLRRLIPVLLLAIAAYMLLRPKLGQVDSHARLKRVWFDVLFGLGIGFYDGFFGPGTGTFWTMAFMLGLGFNLLRATGYTKVMNFASNLSALIFFLMRGNVRYDYGVVMGIGQLLGARIGARLVLARGAAFIRPIFLLVVVALAIRLLSR
jgi:uncharacterized protein